LYIQLQGGPMDEDKEEKALQIGKMVANQCLAGRVRRLNRIITNLYDRALKPYGITVNQANVLVCLLVQGEASPGEIGVRLQMEKSTISRTLDRMKTSDWIAVIGSGPGQTVHITDSGKQLMLDTHDAWQKAQMSARELLGENAIASLLQTVDRLR
jgi:DNA-binding MarR family transcriptional regulator